jgi:hypothetical protein
MMARDNNLKSTHEISHTLESLTEHDLICSYGLSTRGVSDLMVGYLNGKQLIMDVMVSFTGNDFNGERAT